MAEHHVAGADRFSGYAELYDEVRPVPPVDLGDLLAAYCGRPPALVADLGSGSGLSARWASTWSDEVVGIEPNDEMREVARRRTDAGTVGYRKGWSHDTGLPTGGADVVLAVQAFHWMEPEATLAEVHRCLRPGGVFAAIDCDWPPVVGDAVAEAAWDECRRNLRVYETRLAHGATGDELRAPITAGDAEAARYSGIDAHEHRSLAGGVKSWSKAGHLAQIAASGRFRWWREVALASDESGDARRFVGLLRSQGDYQTLRRHGLDDATLGVDRLSARAAARLGPGPRPWRVVWRIRLGFTA